MMYNMPYETVQSVLSFLSRTSALPKGLRELQAPMDFLPSTSALFSEVLVHHAASLLHLSAPTVSVLAAVPESIVPALSHLSRLTHLHLLLDLPRNTASSSDEAMTMIRSLASSISNLPSLANIVLNVLVPDITEDHLHDATRLPPPPKRRKTCPSQSATQAVSVNPVFDALSVAPCLTHLDLQGSMSMLPCPAPLCSSLKGPFQHLASLEFFLYFPRCADDQLCMHVTPEDVPFPSVTLPALTNLRFMYCSPIPAYSSIAPHGMGQALVESMLKQHALRTLEVDLLVMRDSTARLIESSMPDALPHLESADMVFEDDAEAKPANVHRVIRGFAKLSALTCLNLQVSPTVVITLSPPPGCTLHLHLAISSAVLMSCHCAVQQ